MYAESRRIAPPNKKLNFSNFFIPAIFPFCNLSVTALKLLFLVVKFNKCIKIIAFLVIPLNKNFIFTTKINLHYLAPVKFLFLL